MIEILNTIPDIISISQDYVPEHLKGHTLIFYIKEKDCVVLAGWEEHTAAMTELIREHMELPSCNQKTINDKMKDMGAMMINIFEALERICQDLDCGKLER